MSDQSSTERLRLLQRLMAREGITPQGRERADFPLSFAQQRMWFLDQLLVDSSAYNWNVALRLVGHLEVEILRAALQFGQRALELQSDFVVGLYALGLTYCRTGELDRGQDAFDRLLVLSNRAPYFLGWAAVARSLDNRVAEVRALTVELKNRSPREEIQPIARVLLAIAGAHRHETLQALESCVAFKGPSFQLVHVSPFLGSWAGEPAFAALLERLHLGSRDLPRG
jgi:tetratricopeptide (TPR) repeat protein